MSFLGFSTQVPAAASPSTLSSALLPPTLQQRAAMQAVSSSRPKKGAKRGKIVASFFNNLGPRPFRRIGSLEQSIVVSCEVASFALATSIVATSYYSKFFTLSDFPTAAYTNLFDQYRFDEIELWVEPLAAQGTTVFASVYSAVDLDDANTPTAISDVSSKQGALIGNGGVGRYHRWQPHMAVATFSGAFTSYANEVAGWIDSASTGVQHYGLKMALDPTPVSVNYSISIRAKITFRAPGI